MIETRVTINAKTSGKVKEFSLPALAGAGATELNRNQGLNKLKF